MFNTQDARLIIGDRQYPLVNVQVKRDVEPIYSLGSSTSINNVHGQERIFVEAIGPGEPIELDGKSLKDIGLILANLYEQVQEQGEELERLRKTIGRNPEWIT